MKFDPQTGPGAAAICQGSAFDLGRMQGEAFREQLLGVYESLRKIEAFQLRRPHWLPFIWFRRLAARRAFREMEPVVRAASPSMHQRVCGLARGAKTKPDLVWLLQSLEGLLASVDDNTDLAPPGGCSALAVRGSASANGQPVIAHNFDYLPIVQPSYIVRESRPTDGHCSIEFTAAPLAGSVDGVNERGLAVTYNYAQTLSKLYRATIAPTISMRIGEVLATASTVADAVDQLKGCSRWGSGLLMLADASGEIASLELANAICEVRHPEGNDYLYHANKFSCPSTTAVEVPVEATYNDRAPRPLRGHHVLNSSIRRMKRFEALLQDARGLSLDDLTRIMGDHEDGKPSDSTICMHSDYWVTTASVQCLPADRTLRVSYGTTCNANYVDYSL